MKYQLKCLKNVFWGLGRAWKLSPRKYLQDVFGGRLRFRFLLKKQFVEEQCAPLEIKEMVEIREIPLAIFTAHCHQRRNCAAPIYR